MAVMVAAVVLLGLWVDGFTQVRGSTDAWLAAFVHRILLVGDYRAAAGTSMVPNTLYNPLYPALVAVLTEAGSRLGLLSRTDTAGLLWVGHVVAGLAWGGVALALYGLWRPTGGRAVGLVAAGAAFFPPLVSTAGMFRYDVPALALALLTALLAAGAVGEPDRGRWLGAGLALGLVGTAREYLLAPAGGAVVTAVVLDLLLARRRFRRGARRRRRIRVPLQVAAGLLLAGAGVPLALGLSPLGGLEAIVGYGVRDRFGSGRPMTEILLLETFWLPLLLGLAGWGLAGWRSRERSPDLRRWGVMVGLLAPCGTYLLSSQQSPQYYLFAHVLILSGGAGWLLLLPRRGRWRAVRGGVALAVLGGVLAWAWQPARGLRVSGRANTTRFHSEGWPAPPEEPIRILARALEPSAGIPLVVVSGTVENLDALAEVRFGRPVAFLFREWTDRLPALVMLYDGAPLAVLSVESPERGHAPLPPEVEAREVFRMETEYLEGVLWRVPGRPRPPGREDPCRRGGHVRGACLQRVWLQGGTEAVRERILAESRRRSGLLSSQMLWW